MYKYLILLLLISACVHEIPKSSSDLVKVDTPVTGEWRSYNGSLKSSRFANLAEINATNVGNLKIICQYDTKETVSFQTGFVQIDGALFGTTEHDTFSIDPNTCQQNWRSHESYKGSMLKVNRGAAVMDGRVFRGLNNGKVVAYDEKTGKLLWTQTISDPRKGESVDASPIASNGLFYIGVAGGDNKGVKGRMYALEAESGKIAWEFYLVPRGPKDKLRGPEASSPNENGTWKNKQGIEITGGGSWTSYSIDESSQELYVPGGNPAPDFVKGVREGENLFAGSMVVLDAKSGAYKTHYPIVLDDYHDYDVSSAPALFKSHGGKNLMAITPKDGHLYIYDLGTAKQLVRLTMTTITNEKAPLEKSGTRFCPGTQGGSEWNGPAYSPDTNLIYSGQVDWCATVHLDRDDKLQTVSAGQPWTGTSEFFGKMDSTTSWGGWLVATEADSHGYAWKFHADFPVLSGVTPTAGNVIFFGDMGGNFNALNARTGEKLWTKLMDGAIAGGVITYNTGSGQKVAVATGMTSKIWPTKKTTAKVVILGL